MISTSTSGYSSLKASAAGSKPDVSVTPGPQTTATRSVVAADTGTTMAPTTNETQIRIDQTDFRQGVDRLPGMRRKTDPPVMNFPAVFSILFRQLRGRCETLFPKRSHLRFFNVINDCIPIIRSLSCVSSFSFLVETEIALNRACKPLFPLFYRQTLESCVVPTIARVSPAWNDLLLPPPDD